MFEDQLIKQVEPGVLQLVWNENLHLFWIRLDIPALGLLEYKRQ